jgi:GrpB-like predicted nucleotidyltransferase (UPF0157 family)
MPALLALAGIAASTTVYLRPSRTTEARTFRCLSRSSLVSAENIQLVPYDPRWPEMFRAEAKRLLGLLGAAVALRVEHMGSTAVPGLSAKPVIDMLMEVASFESAERTVLPKLREDGWECLWRGDRSPGNLMCVRRNAAGERTHHLHYAPAGHAMWERLAFRDYLRRHPEEGRRYERLKAQLASEHPDDREAYTEGKGEYVKRLTKTALSRLGPTAKFGKCSLRRPPDNPRA